ncbi:TPA: hypothetical protein ACH3X2_000813 [Trebouxia sp. C0005]
MDLRELLALSMASGSSESVDKWQCNGGKGGGQAAGGLPSPESILRYQVLPGVFSTIEHGRTVREGFNSYPGCKGRADSISPVRLPCPAVVHAKDTMSREYLSAEHSGSAY